MEKGEGNMETTDNKKDVTLSSMDISVLCAQLAMDLKAGVALYDGISAVSEDAENPKMKRVIEDMNEVLVRGGALSEAMKESGVFPTYVESMVEIGEASGTLENVMSGLSDYYLRDKAMKDRIRNAVFYPFILFIMLSAVIILLVTKILPVFEDIFAQLGGEISGAAGSMVSWGTLGGAISVTLVGIIVVALIAIVVLSKTESGRRFGQRFFITSPITKNLASRMTARKFAAAMELMLSSGATTEDALRMTKAVIDNPFVEQKLDVCMEQMNNGESFSHALALSGLFPTMFLRLVEIGAKTGYLSDTMQKLADIYEEESENSLGTLTGYIEPCMVGVLALIIGGVLLSVMLPLAGIMSSIR